MVITEPEVEQELLRLAHGEWHFRLSITRAVMWGLIEHNEPEHAPVSSLSTFGGSRCVRRTLSSTSRRGGVSRAGRIYRKCGQTAPQPS
jgi:hypothetical protein